ncbi:MAG: bifunctional nicotinamide-nucleotide adenylyltransferase/Nudix hydroxylase [Deinococcales bacterium]
MKLNPQFTYGVFIGRFQPPHKTHIAVMLEALQAVQKLIVVIGSAKTARNVKNPFGAEERQAMIICALEEHGVDMNRVAFCEVRDYFYNEAMWLAAVQNGVHSITKGSDHIALLGHLKDGSSYYLKSFPQWDFLPTQIVSGLSATQVRQALFCGQDLFGLVEESTLDWLNAFQNTPDFATLKLEYEYIENYKKIWAAAPYPPVFVTTDAVVIKSGFVLVIRRGDQPGKGRLAMPGGFLNQSETLLAGCLRELLEETGLKLEADKHLKNSAVFDYPERSLRGRTITHAFHFDLGLGSLPTIKGSDDASDALWMPLSEALAKPEQFFEDHHAIIEHFVLRQ